MREPEERLGSLSPRLWPLFRLSFFRMENISGVGDRYIHVLANLNCVDTIPLHAAMRAHALLDQGDLAGSAPWGRIGKMTNVLLSKTTYAATDDSMSRDSVQPVESVNQTPTLRDLPSPDIKRWRIQYKALVVTAVRSGLINVAEACARYSITIEEFLSWKRLLDEHGLRGLRTTRLKEYRRPASSASGNCGHSEEVKAQGSGS